MRWELQVGYPWLGFSSGGDLGLAEVSHNEQHPWESHQRESEVSESGSYERDHTGEGGKPALGRGEGTGVAVSTVMRLEDDLPRKPPHNPEAWQVNVSDAWVSHQR